MGQTPVTNFAIVTVSTGYNSSATSIQLNGGHGAKLPASFPYPVAWWNITDYADPSNDPNVEIVTVTNRVSDTLTVTRGAEGTTASNKNTAGKTYMMVLGITAAMWANLLAKNGDTMTGLLTLSGDPGTALQAVPKQYADRTKAYARFDGLVLGTIPNSALQSTQAMLLKCSEIFTDLGTRCTPRTGLVADLGVNGANGLDAGSKTISTWYELYYIFKGTGSAAPDNNDAPTVDALLWHIAKQWNLDQSATGTGTNQKLRDVSSDTLVGQTYAPAVTGLRERFDVQLLKTGAPAGNIWLELYATSSGAPTGSPLATSDKYDVATLATSAMSVAFPFRSPVSLTAGTVYTLVLNGDFTINASNYVSWAGSNTNPYAGGSLYLNNGASWSATAGTDQWFKDYVTVASPAVTMPAQYTEKCLLGYGYVNASGNLKRFWQIDRQVFTNRNTAVNDWKVGNMAASLALVSLQAFLPPTPCLVRIGAGNTAGASNIGVGALRALGLTNLGDGEFAIYHSVAAALGVSQVLTCGVEVPVEYQAAMVLPSATFDLHVATYRW